MTDPILLASDVSFEYEAGKNARRILQNVSIAIEPGSIVAIVGESGSGKSTLAKLLCGMLKPTTGQVQYRGSPLQAPARAGLHLLSQEPFSTFNPYHDVRRILCEPLQAQEQLPDSVDASTELLREILAPGSKDDCGRNSSTRSSASWGRDPSSRSRACKAHSQTSR